MKLINRQIKKMSAFLLAVFFIFLCGCNNSTVAYKNFPDKLNTVDSKEIASNENLTLEYDSKTQNISLKDNNSGKVWSAVQGKQSDVTSNAELYIWDVEMTLGGIDMFSETATQYGNDGSVKLIAMKYADIPFDKNVSSSTASSNADAYLDVDDKYMLLQKNYCYNEEKEVLQYQAFTQWVGELHNGSVLKAETDYILSFDYYADPGEFDSGVMGNFATIKTLDTGHNDVLTKSNMHCLWNEEEQKYDRFDLPNTGYHHIVIEFKTLKNQTDFVVALESGSEGDAYYWNFNLVEKGTNKNLLTYSSFVYPEIKDISSKKIGSMGWNLSTYCYEFVEFKDELTNLKEGEVIGGTNEEEGNDSNSSNTPITIPIIDEEPVKESGMPLYVIVIIIAGSVLIVGGVVTTLIILNKKGIIKFKKKN